MLMHLAMPLVPGHPYLRYEPSEVPALIGSFALGPMAGMAVVVLKNGLYLLAHPQPSELIGIPINTLAGCSLVGVAGWIYSLRKSKHTALISLAIGTLTMTLAMIPLNLVLLPVFQKFFGGQAQTLSSEAVVNLLLWVFVPFNLLKGLLSSTLTFLVYKRVSPALKSDASWTVDLVPPK